MAFTVARDPAASSRSDTEPLDVTVTVVSWNSADVIARCLRSVRDRDGLGIEIHLVDNASSDGTADLARRQFADVRVIRNERNVGFAAACNQSWEAARGRYWMLLNPDTEMQPHALRDLVSFMDTHPAAGLATPTVVGADGDPQPSADLVPSICRSLVEAFRIDKVAPSVFRGRMAFGSDRTSPTPVRVGWACGAALIARREAVDECGPLSERFFMYGEDLEWCLRIRRAGWQVWLCPDPVVMHRGSLSAEKRWDLDSRRRMILDGIYAAVEMHRGRRYLEALLSAQLVALAVESLAARVRRRPPPPAAVVEHHVGALRASLSRSS